MNIFKALLVGNGKISETNITSFISYLFDMTNELKNSLRQVEKQLDYFKQY
ncbi:MAG: hypothetical protein LBL90_08455 [Prevotellaceae bacterium]|jgi:hypothetical protein|nr:hypothetical protein [Prevotellaceae bacterium]